MQRLLTDDIKKAAHDGVNTFLKDKRHSVLHRFGFESQAELDSADLGAGFRIYTIQPSKLLDESIPQDLQSLVEPTDQWEFLVVGGDKTYAMLTVELMDGKQTPVSIGAAGLARELTAIMQTWPVSSGYQYRLIRIYQAHADFIELSQDNAVMGLIPLTVLAAATTGGSPVFDPQYLQDPNGVLQELRSIVERNIKGWHGAK